jgi:hypothetical protein
MTEALQRLRCAKCGDYYWADERHRCQRRGDLVLARPARVRVESDAVRAEPTGGGVRLRLPEPSSDGPIQPAPIDSAALLRRLDTLESQIDELTRTSDRLCGNDSQYEMALELLVAEMVQLKNRISEAVAMSAAASDRETVASRGPRRHMRRRPSPSRRRSAALMMWVFALLVVAGGLAGLVLARMPG